jgi:hypothetical protein
MNKYEYCYCGRLLHFNSRSIEREIKMAIAKFGYCFDVVNGEKTYRVPRTYIALHGINGKDLSKLGFKEIKHV